MKPILIYICMLMLPLAVLAQKTQPPVLEDFAKGIHNCKTFAFDDHLNVMQITTADDKFDMVAVNDKMQVLWKVSLTGYGIKTDKFKNKIVALVSAGHSASRGVNNTYIAYILDPATGKLLANKVVYKSTDEYFEYPQMYTGNGDFFKIAVRQCAFKRKLHVNAIIGGSYYASQLNETRDLQVISFNDQLDSISSFKPAISKGAFISLVWNKQGDMFTSWLNGPSIDVYKYDAGKTAPSNQLTVPVAFKENKDLIPNDLLFLQPGENRNDLYYSLIYLNQDKDAELGVGKLDFENGKKTYFTELFNKANLKAIEKSFVPVNKDFDDPGMGNPRSMTIKYITEAAGKIVITVASHAIIYDRSVYHYEDALLVNVYDKDLNLKFQQILPVSTGAPIFLINGYHESNNNLYVLANNRKGLSYVCAFGALNLDNGKWEKMEFLSKKHLDGSDFSNGESILWFSDNYVIPYFSSRGFSQSKFNLSLQQNQY